MSTFLYQQFLSQNHITFQSTPLGLLFEYHGGHFIITDPDDDTLYLQIVMPNVYRIRSNNLETGKVLRILNELNKKRKAVKGILVDDSVWLNVEMFIDQTPNLSDFFFRILDILHSARLEFSSLYR